MPTFEELPLLLKSLMVISSIIILVGGGLVLQSMLRALRGPSSRED